MKRPLLLTAVLFGWVALLGACSPAPSQPTLDPLDLTATPEAIRIATANAASVANAADAATVTPAPVLDQAQIDAAGTQAAPAVSALTGGTPAVDPDAPTPPPPTGDDNQPAAAVVNGQIITRTTYDRARARFQAQLGLTDEAQLRALAINMLVEQALIEQAAAGQSLTIDAAQLDQEVANARQLAGTDEAWAAWLAQNSYTEAEFRSTLGDALLTSRMRDAVTQDLNGEWLQANARHILVASADEAAALIAQLTAGADFATLAAQHSLDLTSRDNGGDLGWFLPGELLEPALEQAAFQRAIGAIDQPIATALGYHVFEVLAREQRPVADDRRALLAQARFEAWLNTLTDAAVIYIYV